MLTVVSWQNAVLVAAGGAIGSVLRWLVTLAAGAQFGLAFPWGTLVVNVVGSFVIGVVAELTIGTLGVSPGVRLFVATGICGGFTTFSTFSLDALTLARDGAAASTLGYVVGSVALGLIAASLGVATARLVAAHA